MKRESRWGGLALWALMLVGTSASAATTVEYIHTDALGSPVAVTNAAGVVIERTEYAPYGEQLNRAEDDGPGYTGHVADKTTGLNYMQQRYYDPGIGRFLSVDPVTARESGDNFNRYAYAFNNPYKFTDPDGRDVTCDGSNCHIHCNSAPECGGDLLMWGAIHTISDAGAIARILFPIAQKSESSEDRPEPGTAESDEGCVYCVPGEKTSSGKRYVGTADDMEKREKDNSDGRDRSGAEKIDSYKKGDRTDRQNKEQKAMNDRGGKSNLDNKRNEVRESKWEARKIEPPKKDNN